MNNGKRTRKGIKQILQSIPQEKLTIKKFVLNGTKLIDQTSTENAFNDYFANVSNYLAIAIPRTITYTTYSTNILLTCIHYLQYINYNAIKLISLFAMQFSIIAKITRIHTSFTTVTFFLNTLCFFIL